MRGGNQAEASLRGGPGPRLALVGATPRGDRHDFFGALQRLKVRSSLSYASLAQATSRPQSTIHGWVTGRHLPYARDNADFARILELLGADDVDGWMEVLFELRARSAGDDDHPPGIDADGLVPLRIVGTDQFWDATRSTQRLIGAVERRLQQTRSGDDDRAAASPVIVAGHHRETTTSFLCSVLVDFYGLEHTRRHDVPAPTVQYAKAQTGVEWQSPLMATAAFDGVTSRGRVIVIDEFEALLGMSSRDSLGAAVDQVTRSCDAPRTAVVIGLHADHLTTAIGIPVLQSGIEDGVVIAGAADGPLAAH